MEWLGGGGGAVSALLFQLYNFHLIFVHISPSFPGLDSTGEEGEMIMMRWDSVETYTVQFSIPFFQWQMSLLILTMRMAGWWWGPLSNSSLSSLWFALLLLSSSSSSSSHHPQKFIIQFCITFTSHIRTFSFPSLAIRIIMIIKWQFFTWDSRQGREGATS